MADELAAIRARHAAITPGPWAWEDHTLPAWGRAFCGPPSLLDAAGHYVLNRGCAECQDQGDGTDADRAFIAAAPADIATLLTRIATLEADLARATQFLDFLAWQRTPEEDGQP